MPRSRPKGFSSVWFGSQDEETKDKTKARLRASKDVLDQQKEIVLQMMEEVESQETLKTDYSQTDWAYKAAHRNGLREAYKRVLDLITIEV